MDYAYRAIHPDDCLAVVKEMSWKAYQCCGYTGYLKERIDAILIWIERQNPIRNSYKTFSFYDLVIAKKECDRIVQARMRFNAADSANIEQFLINFDESGGKVQTKKHMIKTLKEQLGVLKSAAEEATADKVRMETMLREVTEKLAVENKEKLGLMEVRDFLADKNARHIATIAEYSQRIVTAENALHEASEKLAAETKEKESLLSTQKTLEQVIKNLQDKIEKGSDAMESVTRHANGQAKTISDLQEACAFHIKERTHLSQTINDMYKGIESQKKETENNKNHVGCLAELQKALDVTTAKEVEIAHLKEKTLVLEKLSNMLFKGQPTNP